MLYFDQHSDPDKEFFSKVAAIDADALNENVDGLDDRDFAIIIMGKRPHRRFPIHNPKSALLSLIYFLKNLKNMDPEIAGVAGARIKEACFRFDLGIPPELDRFSVGVENHVVNIDTLQKQAADQKVAEQERLPDEAFGIILYAGGEKRRKFPLHDREHVLKAIQYFPRAEGLTDDQKKTLAKNIAKRAEQYGIETDIAKEASVNPNLKRDMDFRIRDLEPQAQAAYTKLASMVEDGSVTIKEASAVIARLDSEFGINDYKYRLTPDQVITGEYESVLEKSASARDFYELLLGHEKTASDPATNLEEALQSDRREDILGRLEEQFGKDMADAIAADPATIFNSLPVPHKEIIAQIVRGEGVDIEEA